MSGKVKVLPVVFDGRKFYIQLSVSGEGAVTARAFSCGGLISPIFTGFPSGFSSDAGDSVGFSVEDGAVSLVEGWIFSFLVLSF